MSSHESELAELAVGVLDGRRRVETLEHIESCPACAAELASYSEVADGLLGLVHEVEPPVGFEVKVLNAINSERGVKRFRPTRRVALLGAAVALAMGAGVGIGTIATSRPQAPQTAIASDYSVAELTSDGHVVGAALAYGSRPGWLSVSFAGLPGGRAIDCVVKTGESTSVNLGTYWTSGGSGSWSVRLPVSARDLRRIELTDSSGKVLASAEFAT